MSTITKPRPWISDRHLRGLATGPAGSISIMPLRDGEVYIDAASANSLPANLPEGDHGATVLNIGRGVQVRATANLTRNAAGAWEVTRELYGSQYPSRREMTATQRARAATVIVELVTEWAATHAGDLAQADDIDRNNAAHVLETDIARHEEALAILRAQLAACEEGEPFTRYPDLPTKR